MQENSIRPPDIFSKYLSLSEKDIADYFPNQPGKRVMRLCPACGSEFYSPAFVKNSFQLATCDQCATLYVTDCPAPEALARFYRDSPSQRFWAYQFFPSVAEVRREQIFKPRVERIIRTLSALGEDLTSCKAVADVGAGAGLFLSEFQKQAPEVMALAVEPNVDLASQCRDKGFTVVAGFADEAAQAGWAGRMDLVVSFEVLEHVASPCDFLCGLRDLAKPGGLIAFTGVLVSGFDVAVLGEHSNTVFPPHHLNFLTRKGVEQLLVASGLQLCSFQTPGVLDVDIVRNKLLTNPDAVTDRFARDLVLNGDDEQRRAFQHFLTEFGLSSHMMVLAKRPL